MSYIRISDSPNSEICPFHQVKFDKKPHFYKCPHYHLCGFSIGSRRRQGYVTKMWLQQTKAGQKWMKETIEQAYEDSWPRSG